MIAALRSSPRAASPTTARGRGTPANALTGDITTPSCSGLRDCAVSKLASIPTSMRSFLRSSLLQAGRRPMHHTARLPRPEDWRLSGGSARRTGETPSRRAPASPTSRRSAAAAGELPPMPSAALPFLPRPLRTKRDRPRPPRNERRIPLQVDTGASVSYLTPGFRVTGVKVSPVRAALGACDCLGRYLHFYVDTRRTEPAANKASSSTDRGDFWAVLTARFRRPPAFAS